MADYPTLYYGTDGQPAAGYGEMWTTEDLSKVQESFCISSGWKPLNPDIRAIMNTPLHMI